MKDLPHYCAGGVLRSPTMWLGIFTGGCVNAQASASNFRSVDLVQILHVVVNYVPYPRCHSHQHFPHLYHLLATPDFCHLLPTYPNGRCTLRLLQADRGIPQAGKGWKHYRCESAIHPHRLWTHFTSSIIMEMDGYGMLSSLFYTLISLVRLARYIQKLVLIPV